jgi:hypothetical protein
MQPSVLACPQLVCGLAQGATDAEQFPATVAKHSPPWQMPLQQATFELHPLAPFGRQSSMHWLFEHIWPRGQSASAQH